MKEKDISAVEHDLKMWGLLLTHFELDDVRKKKIQEEIDRLKFSRDAMIKLQSDQYALLVRNFKKRGPKPKVVIEPSDEPKEEIDDSILPAGIIR